MKNLLLMRMLEKSNQCNKIVLRRLGRTLTTLALHPLPTSYLARYCNSYCLRYQ